MRKRNLNQEQVIKIVGEELVNKLDGLNCDFTNRLQTDNDDSVEFSASVKFTDEEGTERVLTAYYYQKQEELDKYEDLDGLNWEIEGYEID